MQGPCEDVVASGPGGSAARLVREAPPNDRDLKMLLPRPTSSRLPLSALF